ncbi:MAG: PilX N-terminal domain-containing pilus assembly protein [Caldicoprobacterales bacterium]|jgi:Tfp pilus assembly protein PilX|nr:hypothetical protein [Clostridiales bacterium]
MWIGSKGSAIIIVLLVLLVLCVLGITLLSMDQVHLKILASDKLHQAAYYFAEAGLTQQMEVFRNNMESLYKDPKVKSRQSFLANLLATPIKPPEFNDYLNHKVKINITSKINSNVLGKDELILVSTCSIGNIKRSIKAVIHVQWRDPNDPDFKLDHSCFYITEWVEVR